VIAAAISEKPAKYGFSGPRLRYPDKPLSPQMDSCAEQQGNPGVDYNAVMLRQAFAQSPSNQFNEAKTFYSGVTNLRQCRIAASKRNVMTTVAPAISRN